MRMVHVVFDPGAVRLGGGGDQSGGDFFVGRPFQRGTGLGRCSSQRGEGVGDVLKTMWRYLKPIAASVGKEGLSAGSRILSNIAEGANLKETVKNEGKEGIKRALVRASNKLQSGGGVRIRRVKKRKGVLRNRIKGRNPKTAVILKPDPDLVGKTVPASVAGGKKAKSDALGLF